MIFKTNVPMTAAVDADGRPPRKDVPDLEKTPQTGKMVSYRTQESDDQRL